MAEAVDSIIADLIVRGVDQYEANFNRASAAHGKFQKSVDALKGQTFDLQAEGRKYKAGLDTISGAEEQTTAKITRTRKARADSATATDKTEAASAKAAAKERSDAAKATAKAEADAAKQIANAKRQLAAEEARLAAASRAATRAEIEGLERLKAAEREASNQAKANAFLTGSGNRAGIQRSEVQSAFGGQLARLEAEQVARESAPVASRPPINLFSDYDARQAARGTGGAGLGATVDGRREAAAATDIMRRTQVGGAQEDVAAEREVNAALVEQTRLQAGLTSARGADRTLIREQIADMRTYNQLIKAGLDEEAAAVELDRIRVARSVAQNDAQKLTASSAGKNALRFGEGAGLGRSFGSAATVGGIVTGAAIAGVAELAKQGLEYALSLKQDSDQLGLTTRDLQIYRRAAQEAGLTTEQFKEGIGQLGDNLGKAQEGSKAQGLIFQRLHIDIGNAQTGYKSLSEILPTLSDRLSQITDKTQRQAVEQALGGEQLRKMDPILSEGAAAFDAYGKSIEKAGGILSNSEIQRSAETAKKIALLNAELQRDLASTVSNNAKSIEQLATAFLNLADGALKAFGYLRQIDNLDVINGGLNSKVRDAISGTSPGDDRKRAYTELLETPQGRQSLLARNSQTLNALNTAGQGKGLDFTAPDLGDVADNPQARYAAHQKAIAERATILRVGRAYDAKANQGQAPVQPGKPDGNILAGPDKKGPKGKSPEDLAQAEIERQKQFSDQLASLQEEALRAQESMTGSIQEQAKDEDQLAAAQYAKKIGDINSNLAKQLQQIAKDYPKGGGETFAAEAVENAKTLRALATIADNVGKQARDQQTAAELVHAQTAHLQTQLSIDLDALGIQESLARTSKDRLKYQLQILEKERQQALAPLEDQLKTLKPGDPALADVQKKIDAINDQQAGKVAEAKNNELSPGQSYVRSLQPTSDTIEDKQVQVLERFNQGLDDAVSKALHLHGIFGDIIKDLIDMVIKQGLIAPLAGALFPGTPGVAGAPSGGIGGLFKSIAGAAGSIFGGGGFGSFGNAAGFTSAINAGASNSLSAILAGARADGGPVAPGSTYLVGERGPELLRMGPSGGTVIPNHAITAVNPNARVNSPQAGGVTLHQTVHIDASGVNPDGYTKNILGIVRSETGQALAQASQKTLQASPGYVRQTQVLKG